jgi:hypothetical protein
MAGPGDAGGSPMDGWMVDLDGKIHGKSPSKMDENRENALFHINFMDIL